MGVIISTVNWQFALGLMDGIVILFEKLEAPSEPSEIGFYTFPTFAAKLN